MTTPSLRDAAAPGSLVERLEALASERETAGAFSVASGERNAYRHAAQLVREYEGGGLRWTTEQPTCAGWWWVAEPGRKPRLGYVTDVQYFASTGWSFAGPVLPPPPSEPAP